ALHELLRYVGSPGDKGRRFGDLFNLVYDPAFLRVAWERVATNKGAPGYPRKRSRRDRDTTCRGRSSCLPPDVVAPPVNCIARRALILRVSTGPLPARSRPGWGSRSSWGRSGIR